MAAGVPEDDGITAGEVGVVIGAGTVVVAIGAGEAGAAVWAAASTTLDAVIKLVKIRYLAEYIWISSVG